MFEKLQYISQGLTVQEQFTHIQQALDAGCTWIQLRFKNAKEDEIHPLAEQIRESCHRYSAKLIINDHPHIASAVNADGVHLGLNDMPVTAARKITGDTAIIGGTANTIEQVLQRVGEGCSYIGVGPFRFTSTKEKLSPVLGVLGYQRIMDILAEKNIHLPVYAIGGIQPEDLPAILSTGVYGIAVSGIITRHPAKKQLVQQLNAHLYETIHHCG